MLFPPEMPCSTDSTYSHLHAVLWALRIHFPMFPAHQHHIRCPSLYLLHNFAVTEVPQDHLPWSGSRFHMLLPILLMSLQPNPVPVLRRSPAYWRLVWYFHREAESIPRQAALQWVLSCMFFVLPSGVDKELPKFPVFLPLPSTLSSALQRSQNRQVLQILSCHDTTHVSVP